MTEQAVLGEAVTGSAHYSYAKQAKHNRVEPIKANSSRVLSDEV
jgi:hypothetical protein